MIFYLHAISARQQPAVAERLARTMERLKTERKIRAFARSCDEGRQGVVKA